MQKKNWDKFRNMRQNNWHFLKQFLNEMWRFFFFNQLFLLIFNVDEKSGTIYGWILHLYYMIYSIKGQVISMT